MQSCLSKGYVAGSVTAGDQVYYIGATYGDSHIPTALIVMKKGLSNAQFLAFQSQYAAMSKRDEPEPVHRIADLFQSFQLTAPVNVLEQLRRNPRVSMVVEQDIEILNSDPGHIEHTYPTPIPPPKRRRWLSSIGSAFQIAKRQARKVTLTTQANSPAHLKFISQTRSGPKDYTYDSRGGRGIMVYVIDSGMVVTA